MTAAGPHEDDLSLARDAIAGRPAAVDRLVERLRCLPRILAARNRHLGRPLSDDELVDVAQATAVVVWRKLGSYAGRAALETWLYRFCELELLNAVRRKRRQPTSGAADDSTLASVDAATSTDVGGAAAFDEERLRTCLGRLLAEEAEVVRLKHFDELTFEDMSTALRVPSSTLKTRYYRALAKLRRMLLAGTADREER